MIHVENLSKHFGRVRAVDGVSFDVARGEVVGLLGPNGAGKTTTMRMITGYLTPDGGAATVNGIPVDGAGIEARRCIGYLPENAPLYTDMETVEYLEYIARLRGISSKEISVRIKEMVGTCGLGQVIGRPLADLSKGFRQRVGLAAAMIHQPPILILDEPTSGLDPNQIIEIRELIKEIGRERTVILSTHIMQEVEATCSRALIINAGRLVGHGTISELLKRTAVESHYMVTARATRERIEREIEKLSGLMVGNWLSAAGDERQRFMLKDNGGSDRAEDIFQWAASNSIPLSELVRETASLEEVFRELTQNP